MNNSNQNKSKSVIQQSKYHYISYQKELSFPCRKVDPNVFLNCIKIFLTIQYEYKR